MILVTYVNGKLKYASSRFHGLLIELFEIHFLLITNELRNKQDKNFWMAPGSLAFHILLLKIYVDLVIRPYLIRSNFYVSPVIFRSCDAVFYGY